VLIGNLYHKRYNFADPIYNGTAAWFIEGIGHQFGIVETACMTPDWSSNFLCYAENGESLFQEGAVCELTVNIPEIHPVVLNPKISPNPTTGLVSVEFNTPHEMQISVQILDITGRIIKNEDWLVNDGLNARCIDLSGFRNGFYLIVFKGINCGSLFNQRVVLQH
jgi:hypothetical protein